MGTGPLPGLLWVLSALVTPGDFLSCKVCTSSSAEYCKGSSVVVCPEGHVCASSYTMTNTHGAIFDMSCAPKHHCDSPGSMSASNGRIQRSTTCCYTDNCTPPHPMLPDDNFQPNGLSCPTCLSVYSKWCYSKQTIACTGEEDACLLQTSEYYAPIRRSLAIRGCATKSICSLGTQWIRFGTLKMKFKYSCVFSGVTCLHTGLITRITVALAVVKYMYVS
ncbi:phospholipase A2 inhibitor and Ly6/PLAUR domain-containing protein-like [Anomaloglossus baeobatrachus]|uniref:phospholipase A2 inhibitor and Ly6/PLAUR domain-containing protein-like n=1 Tax=Anomaloglossus baeobatrachus TaxID=238106 RepID=UPI003F503EEA